MKIVDRLFAAWTAVVLLFLYVPIVILVVYSFNTSRLNVQWQGFTFDWYRALLHDRPLIDALENSLIIAAFVTVLSVVLGTLGAWLLYRYRFPLPRLINTLIFTPMIIPEIIMGVSLLIFFATINTWGNAWLSDHHVTDAEPLSLGFLTVIIAHVTFCFPFVLVGMQARLAGLDPSLEEAAMDLGATPLRAFWHVIVPYLLPAIVSGALMSFTQSMDELVVTYFTASAKSVTLPVLFLGRVRRGLDPSLNAISALFILSTGLLILVSEWFRRRSRLTETAILLET